MFDRRLIEQAAPTLAGIKPGSLFPCSAQELGDPAQSLQAWDEALAPRGIRVKLMKQCPATGRCLVYVYRPAELRTLLARPGSRALLNRMGYRPARKPEALLEQLADRLCLEREFPHEIGLFLGYPLEDVEGFIQNKGQNYTCFGWWKVYGDPEAAQQRFEQLRCCTQTYLRRFERGSTVIQLAVAV